MTSSFYYQYFILVLLLLTNFISQAQQLDIDGKVKINVMELNNANDSLAVWTSDGTLARRDLSSLPFTEFQILSISNDTIFLSNGGFAKLPADGDADPTNEIQILSISNDTIFLSSGGFAKLPADGDNDPTNEIQELTVSEFGDTLFVEQGNYLIIPGVSAANGPKDGDGYIYKTVEINGQYWFAENLRTTTYNDGTPLPHVLDNSIWKSFNQPAYCYYGNDSIINRQEYGALYNSFAIRTTNPKNVCPVNWHVATAENWDSVIVHLGGLTVAGGKLKEIGLEHWGSPNVDATDEVDFAGRGGGGRLGLGNFFQLKQATFFWGIRRPTDTSERSFQLNRAHDDVTEGATLGSENFGFSVRCVRDSL